MHFLLCINFRKMWSHAVSMGSSLLLDFSFYCSFGKKKCMIFAVHSTFLNHRTELSSVSHVGADHHVESWGESSAAFLGEWKAKLDVLIPTQPFKKLPRIQIWEQTNRMSALRLCLLLIFSPSWSSYEFSGMFAPKGFPWHSDDVNC